MTLRQQYEAAQTEIEELTAELAAAKTVIAAKNKKIARLEAKIEQLTNVAVNAGVEMR